MNGRSSVIVAAIFVAMSWTITARAGIDDILMNPSGRELLGDVAPQSQHVPYTLSDTTLPDLTPATPQAIHAATPITAPAGAIAAQPQADGSVIYLYPLISYIEQFVLAAIGTVAAAGIPVLVGFLSVFLKKKWNYDFSQNEQAETAAALKIFADAAKTKAGAFIAQSDPSWKTAQITASHPWIAAAANEVIATSTDLAAQSGMTPDILAGKIAGEIGKLQAAPAVAAAPTVVVGGAPQ